MKMREILFRAKAINRDSIDGRCRRTDYKNGDWVYGLITKPNNEEYDFPAEMRNTDGVTGIEVDYKTIGQFTGLTDKNGVKIFEGDIVEYETGKKVRIGRVFFSDFRASFSVTAGKNGSARINNDLYNYIQNRNSVIVIGNIYDNPELIGGAEDEQNKRNHGGRQ
jgi:uncharacterized phage protein (TIGR01671 family)